MAADRHDAAASPPVKAAFSRGVLPLTCLSQDLVEWSWVARQPILRSVVVAALFPARFFKDEASATDDDRHLSRGALPHSRAAERESDEPRDRVVSVNAGKSGRIAT